MIDLKRNKSELMSRKKKSLFWFMIPEEESKMAEKVWQRAARTWNWDITSSTMQREHGCEQEVSMAVNKKWGEAINLKAHPSDVLPPTSLHLLKVL